MGAGVEVGAVVAVGSGEPHPAINARITDNAAAEMRILDLVSMKWTVPFYSNADGVCYAELMVSWDVVLGGSSRRPLSWSP